MFILRFLKNLSFITVIGFIILLASCGETGGTIVVKNNFETLKEVAVFSDVSFSLFWFEYKDMYGPEIIPAGETREFNVTSNTTYHVFWRYFGEEWERNDCTITNVSKGETVFVDIPSFFRAF
jgi:hypothetical protein